MNMKDSTKDKIDSMTLGELSYQIELGRSSPYQREKMGYIKSRYSMLNDSGKKYQVVMLEESIPMNDSPSTEDSTSDEKWHNKAVGKIFISVASIVIATMLVWALAYYLGIELK